MKKGLKMGNNVTCRTGGRSGHIPNTTQVLPPGGRGFHTGPFPHWRDDFDPFNIQIGVGGWVGSAEVGVLHH